MSPLPQSEDSGALGIYFTTLCKSTPLSYPGTDEEEELDVPPPVPTAEERNVHGRSRGEPSTFVLVGAKLPHCSFSKMILLSHYR